MKSIFNVVRTMGDNDMKRFRLLVAGIAVLWMAVSAWGMARALVDDAAFAREQITVQKGIGG